MEKPKDKTNVDHIVRNVHLMTDHELYALLRTQTSEDIQFQLSAINRISDVLKTILEERE